MTAIVKGACEAPRAVQPQMDTILVTAKQIEQWQLPSFQRWLMVNPRVLRLSEEIKATKGIIPGVITLGELDGHAGVYIVDGQHRIKAFEMSGLTEGIMDVRIVRFKTMGEMAEEFVQLQSRLVTLKPDDVLRAMECQLQPLQRLREACPFVGYGKRGAGLNKATGGLSMSAVIRAWTCSGTDAPTGGYRAVAVLAEEMDPNSAEQLVQFLLTAAAAWGHDVEYARLWGVLNLTMTMWLWRRLVLDRDRRGIQYEVITIAQFKKCLMAVSASHDYVDWLRGRSMTDRDRSPCYNRIKALFVARMIEEKMVGSGKRPKMPAPSWASEEVIVMKVVTEKATFQFPDTAMTQLGGGIRPHLQWVAERRLCDCDRRLDGAVHSDFLSEPSLSR